MMMCVFVLLALSVGFCAGSQRIYSDEGTLVANDNYQVSWVVDRIKSEVTFTVSAVTSERVFFGFSLTNNFLEADVFLFILSDGNVYDYDLYTTDDSSILLTDVYNNNLDDFDQFQDNPRNVFTFTRPIKSDSDIDDISLQQCVYVIWGYDTNYNVNLSTFPFSGIFPQQLCLQEPPPCPAEGTSTCEKRILEVGCRSLKLKDPGRQLPRSCSAM